MIGLEFFEFLVNLCRVHGKSKALSQLINDLWKQHPKVMQSTMDVKKSMMTNVIEYHPEESARNYVQQLASLMRSSRDTALFHITGSDFLDALVWWYDHWTSVEGLKTVVATSYLGFMSLVEIESPNVSLLSDHLYSLRAQADKARAKPSLLADLVTNTPLIAKLKRKVSGDGATRLLKLLESLET